MHSCAIGVVTWPLRIMWRQSILFANESQADRWRPLGRCRAGTLGWSRCPQRTGRRHAACDALIARRKALANCLRDGPETERLPPINLLSLSESGGVSRIRTADLRIMVPLHGASIDIHLCSYFVHLKGKMGKPRWMLGPPTIGIYQKPFQSAYKF